MPDLDRDYTRKTGAVQRSFALFRACAGAVSCPDSEAQWPPYLAPACRNPSTLLMNMSF